MSSTFPFHPLFSPTIQASDPFSGISTPFMTIVIIVVVVLVLWWLLRVQTSQVDEVHVDEHDHGEHAEHSGHDIHTEPAGAGMMAAGSGAGAASAEMTALAGVADHEEDAAPAGARDPQEDADQTAAAQAGEVDESGDAAPAEPDDLKKLEGVGPKVESVLHAAGIKTFGDLAAAEVNHLQALLDAADYQYMDPGSWPEQARLAAAGDWEALQKLQDELLGGK